VVINPGPDADRAQRLAMQAIEAARQAATNMAAELHAELERQPRESSRSPMCR
jgi:hypothetical protein